MSALSTLTLSHFRSHKLTRLVPKGRSVILFGANGAGKTNILEAVSILSPGRGLRRAAAGDMVRRPDGVGWKVAGRVAGHDLETWVEGSGARQVRIDGKAATQTALGQHLSVVWLTPAMDRLWTEGADGRRRFIDRITLSFDAGHGEAVLAYEKAMRERNRLLKDQVRDDPWYRALETQMAQSGAAIETARDAVLARLLAAQADGNSAFPKADLALAGPEDGMRLTSAETLEHALAASRAMDLRAGRTLVGPHRTDLSAAYADKGVAAREASTGEQKALLISVVLASARALMAEDRAPVILLDEVAAHLDETRRAALFAEIEGQGAQAWMTGTDADLFEAAGARNGGLFDECAEGLECLGRGDFGHRDEGRGLYGDVVVAQGAIQRAGEAVVREAHRERVEDCDLLFGAGVTLERVSESVHLPLVVEKHFRSGFIFAGLGEDGAEQQVGAQEVGVETNRAAERLLCLCRLKCFDVGAAEDVLDLGERRAGAP